MEEMQLIEAVERYLRGEMTQDERARFEQLRRDNAEIDQKVVEHSILFNRLAHFGERRNFVSALHDIHVRLLDEGEIKDGAPRAKLVDLFKKYSRVTAVAACIGGFTALAIYGLVSYLTPKANTAYVEQLSRKVDKVIQNQQALSKQITYTENAPKIPTDAKVKSGGTSFMIDARGYLVTNAHVISDQANVVVQNSRGQEFKARIIKIDRLKDLAILKIEDADFKSASSLPYGFKNSGADLGEEIFTMGFPRDEIVYGEGYMSAKTGFNGDTLACQIAVAANPGNSGGPVINKNGEIVGILSTRQIQAEGVVFAIKAQNIFNIIDELKQDTSYQSLKLMANSTIKTLDRVQQIKKIEDCVFMVKTY
ncbi:MAG: trypsin-like peptidase domain-containing protein [Chitinophagaceae bacterium]